MLKPLQVLVLTINLLAGKALAKDTVAGASKLTVSGVFSAHSGDAKVHRPFSQRLHTEGTETMPAGIDPTITIVETMLPPLKNKHGDVLTISDLCPIGELGVLYAMAGAGGMFEISLSDWSVKTFLEDEPGVMGTNGQCIVLAPHIGYTRYNVTSGMSTFSGYHAVDGKFEDNVLVAPGEIKSVFFGQFGLLLAMIDGRFMMQDTNDDQVMDKTSLITAQLNGSVLTNFPALMYPIFIGEHDDGKGGMTSFVGILGPEEDFVHPLNRRVSDAFIDITTFEGGFVFKDSYDIMQVTDDEEVLLPLAGDRLVSGSRDGPADSARFGELAAVSYSSAIKTFFVADSNGLRRMIAGSRIKFPSATFLDSLPSVKGAGISMDGTKKYAYDLQFGPGTSIVQHRWNGEGSSSLGTVQASNYKGDGKFSFDGGDKCKNGVRRRGTLQLLCAEADTIFVTETERCVYEILYASAYFCE